jgi:putative ABC transport system ATP-binding protein
MEKIIEIKRLRKSFQSSKLSNDVLKDISLDIYSGDFAAIEGPSGSGKSTLLSILGLLDEHSEGTYKLCNTDIDSLTSGQLSTLRNKNIGWIFQNFNLINDLTVEDNVSLPLKYRKEVTNNDKKMLTYKCLKLVGLDDMLTLYPNQLSGGQQQRVGIARALIVNPDLILADEPTGNLDSGNTENVMQILLDLNSNGKTIIMVTHDPQLALRANKRFYMLDGKFIDR